TGAAVADVRDIVACGAEATILREVQAAIAAQAVAARAVTRATLLRAAVSAVGGQLPLVAVLVAAPWLLDRGQLSAGGLLGVVTYIAGSLQPAFRATVQTA